MANGNWYWAEHKDTERWFGPFETREEALRDGQLDMLDEVRCEPAIGRGEYPDPGEFVRCLSLGEILERMDEWASDDDCYTGDEVLFVVKRQPGECETSDADAEAALHAALRAWADEWLVASVATVTPEREWREWLADADVWECTCCGERPVASDSRWRWNSERWEHNHGYPLGHVPAIRTEVEDE